MSDICIGSRRVRSPEAALIAALIRAVDIVALSTTTAPSREAIWCCSTCEQASSRPRRRNPRAACVHGFSHRQPNDARAGWAKSFSAAVPGRVRRRQPTRLAGPHVVPSVPSGRGRARRRRGSRSVATAGPRSGAGRDRSVNRRYPRNGRRQQLRSHHVQPRVAQQASAGIRVQAVRVRGGPREGLLTRVGLVESDSRDGPEQPGMESAKRGG